MSLKKEDQLELSSLLSSIKLDSVTKFPVSNMKDIPFNYINYEIVFKTGKLVKIYDEGFLLEAVRDSQVYKSYIPYKSIKSVDIF